MCEFYYGYCDDETCVETAKIRAEMDRVKYGEEYFTNRSGKGSFLHKGVFGPCKHMIEDHGPECQSVKQYEDERYGLIYDTCNCDPRDDNESGWAYYV